MCEMVINSGDNLLVDAVFFYWHMAFNIVEQFSTFSNIKDNSQVLLLLPKIKVDKCSFLTHH